MRLLACSCSAIIASAEDGPGAALPAPKVAAPPSAAPAAPGIGAMPPAPTRSPGKATPPPPSPSSNPTPAGSAAKLLRSPMPSGGGPPGSGAAPPSTPSPSMLCGLCRRGHCATADPERTMRSALPVHQIRLEIGQRDPVRCLTLTGRQGVLQQLRQRPARCSRPARDDAAQPGGRARPRWREGGSGWPRPRRPRCEAAVGGRWRQGEGEQPFGRQRAGARVAECDAAQVPRGDPRGRSRQGPPLRPAGHLPVRGACGLCKGQGGLRRAARQGAHHDGLRRQVPRRAALPLHAGPRPVHPLRGC